PQRSQRTSPWMYLLAAKTISVSLRMISSLRRDPIQASSGASTCFEEASLIAGAIVFIIVQLCLLLVWTFLWKRKRALLAKEVLVPGFGSSESGFTASSDSLSYLYESRIPHARRNR
ncbi:Putative LOC101887535, partial [Caligus rogercresseyi]